jgi:hypothetical protein
VAAKAERLEAEEQRLIRRVERVGELVEELFWKAYSDRAAEHGRELARASYVIDAGTVAGPPENLLAQELEARSWMAARNRLSQALVGLRGRLPQCAALLHRAKMPDQAIAHASMARTEVETELKYLHGELIRPG